MQKIFKKKFALGKSKGFTLIELLVVMAIIAILVTLMIWAINAARMQSRNTERSNNAKTMAASLETFYASRRCYVDTAASATCVAGEMTNAVDLDTLAATLTGENFYNNTDRPITDPSDEKGRQCYRRVSRSEYEMWVVPEPGSTGTDLDTCSADLAAAQALHTNNVQDFSIRN